MKVAIHKSNSGFSNDWIKYCEEKNIEIRIVNCYKSDIIQQLNGCDVLLWHHHHTDAKDVLFAKGLLFALQHSGMKVFPDFNAGWHFDDKVGQKYLLEALKIPSPKSWVFYERQEALRFIQQLNYPIVFKLRGGAGSNNVKLLRNANIAAQYVHRAFSSGFSNYDRWNDLKENWRKFKFRKIQIVQLMKSIRRLFVGTSFSKVRQQERGYIYFQDFIPNNTFDIRIVVIGLRAFGIKRMVRNNDFRASGSGFIKYDKDEIDERCVQLAFETSRKLNSSVVAYDFVFDQNNNPLIVEINYGYAHKSYFACPGYWDSTLRWHDGKFNSSHWIIEEVLNTAK